MEITSLQDKDINFFESSSDVIIPSTRELQNNGYEKDFSHLNLDQIEARKQVFKQRIFEKFGITKDQVEADLKLLANELSRGHFSPEPDKAFLIEYLTPWLSNNTFNIHRAIVQFTKRHIVTPREYKLSKSIKKQDKDEYLKRLYELGVVEAGLGLELRRKDDPREIDQEKVNRIMKSNDFGNLGRYAFMSR